MTGDEIFSLWEIAYDALQDGRPDISEAQEQALVRFGESLREFLDGLIVVYPKYVAVQVPGPLLRPQAQLVERTTTGNGNTIYKQVASGTWTDMIKLQGELNG